jgi:hypothetical protein
MAPPSEPDNPLTDLQRSNATRSKEALDRLRQRADTTAKAFGGLATTLITAIGIAKIGDIFPLEVSLGPIAWAAAVFVGFALMATAIAFFTARLWRVTKPILARTDPSQMTDDLDKSERALVQKVYEDAAKARGISSIRAYGRRGNRLARIADGLDHPPSAAKLRKRAAAIGVDLDAVMSRAIALVVRQRTGQVIRSGWSVVAFATFVLGAILFATASDRLESARASEIAVAKSCAEARTAYATEESLQDCAETNQSLRPRVWSPSRKRAPTPERPRLLTSRSARCAVRRRLPPARSLRQQQKRKLMQACSRSCRHVAVVGLSSASPVCHQARARRSIARSSKLSRRSVFDCRILDSAYRTAR